MLVADRHGTLTFLNAAARDLLPDAAPGTPLGSGQVPAWLAAAHGQLTSRTRPQGPRVPQPRAGNAPAAFRGEIADGFFEAHPTEGPEGKVVWWLVDDTGRHAAQGALDDARSRARVLAEASSRLQSTLHVPRCMEETASMAAQHFAEAAVLVAPPKGRTCQLTYARRGMPVVQATLAVDVASVPGLSEALQGFPPVPARWIDPAGIPAWAIPDGFTTPLGSVIITPLPGHGVPAGALILLRSSTEQAFTEGEEAFARLFAARAGAALSAARLYTEQAAITATLMRDLLPPTLQAVAGVEYAGHYRTAEDHERIGGDFYDVHPGASTAEETHVVLGDVAGKGLDAAVMTGKIRNTLHALLPLAADHQHVLNLLNSALLSSHHTRFATLVLASVRRHGSRVRLRLTSAGHMAPLILRADGTVQEAATQGTLVGALPAVTARTVEAVLHPGETCLLYTDGITEARGGPMGDELFGEDQLKQVLAQCAGFPADAVVERVQMLASQWAGTGPHDDMAVVAITAPRARALSLVPDTDDETGARRGSS
ncbi:PP2C family protein-serine/threonine phosphatase [Streptomyces sp. NPDC001941]|uniref:PP2C family protein-serine/threonine phosphatase n=1 Tax=Streptomyces sp. NPDC001941 TaxID=3154659 RepID=UPI003329750B